MRLPTNLICLTLSVLPSVIAVYSDEAYSVDYHHELLGLPLPHTTFFYRPRKDDKASLIYTLSDLGVLGAVNPGVGTVVWRQLLADYEGLPQPGFLRPIEGENTVVSAIGSRVDAWDALSGKSVWGTSFEGAARDVEVMEIAAGSTEAKDVLALFEEGGTTYLRKLKGTTGDVVWEFKDGSVDTPLQVSTNVRSVFVVSLHGSSSGYNLKITVLDPVTGKRTTEYTLTTKLDVHAPEDVLLVGANSAAPIVAWADKAMKTLKVNLLGKPGDIQSLPLKDSDGAIKKVELHAPHLVQSLPHFLVHSHTETSNRADVYHIDLASGNIKKAYDLPKLPGQGAISVSSQEANVYFTRLTQDEVIVVSSASHGILGRWPLKLETAQGSLVHGAAEVVQKSSDGYAIRSAVLTTEQDWVLVRNGAESWVRPEGLSGVIAAAWAELPESENLVKNLEVEAESNPVSAYMHRVNRHINDLQYLPQYLQALPRRFLSSIIPAEIIAPKIGVLTKDSFGFNKLVIVATQRGRIYGLDAGNQGRIVWSATAFPQSEGRSWDVKGIWVENLKGQTTIRGSDGEYVIVNTTSGTKIESVAPGSWPTLTATALVDSTSGKWLLPIGIDGNPGDIPSEWAPKDTIVVRSGNGEVKGLRFEPKTASPNSEPVMTWSFTPPADQRIIKVVSRPAHDPVASIGRVLGDRTVLYKYLNPNVALITAVSDEKLTASFYLIDTVSGDLLYSVSHEGVDTTQPITSALTENWFTYSLWGDITTDLSLPSTLKGYQIVISEMYESDVPNDRGPLSYHVNSSSLEPSDIPNADPSLPHVVSETFLIPEAISHMSVTQTRQGITVRQLLCTLASSRAIIGIPKQILDPRRPIGRAPTAAEQEEGLFQYTPNIEFDPKIILTHQREVIGVKDVIASPAILESTSLIFAYGVDVFGTRVAPSAAFDILGKGFNKISLVATVAALWVGVVVLAPMASLFPY
ncbi:Quinoprotein alcohol dehydrogenase-like protein [Glarea lozoyensis ATCC 20868]|uniref:ER membrane protein complex subunit 1 n=1 Tax=Glarea lozoyensis (strain ATCC 20868 / MF5171) TaxID=1116229 RepID=S3DSS6_GLAL2|nr:Quinoprotein alcohol dehydrogenase-like protein [Glarea lozoyensis ATCC 20868]EPE35026.1 Quinoprotein alcohol dehydrogenase-like protein [Glarea lozoyensis ATCC 20868]